MNALQTRIERIEQTPEIARAVRIERARQGGNIGDLSDDDLIALIREDTQKVIAAGGELLEQHAAQAGFSADVAAVKVGDWEKVTENFFTWMGEIVKAELDAEDAQQAAQIAAKG